MKHLKSYRRRDDLKDTDIIFICNPTAGKVTDTVEFDPGDRSVELWDPYTKEMFKLVKNGKLSVVLEPYGSRFLVVRPGESTKPDMRIIRPLAETAVKGKWRVDFPGAKEILTDSLFSWPDSDEDDLKYYSETVKYKLDFNFEKNESTSSDIHYFLSLGDVKNMAKVTMNNRELPILWKSPFECDVTEMLNNGKNTLDVEVTNLWPNRMIGDEQEPDDLEWSEPLVYSYSKPPVSVGSYLKSNPDWLRNGTLRPSKNRKTVGCFKFFTKDSPLLPSGLLGPVTIKECSLTVE